MKLSRSRGSLSRPSSSTGRSGSAATSSRAKSPTPVRAGGEDEGVTTRFLRFEAGAGNDAVVTHDFWEEIYIVSGTLECGGRPYPAGSVAVRPPGMPHGPFHSATGCVSFEVRYRVV